MRVNIEDDLHLSGRLSAFSRFLGMSEEQGIGRLYWVYRETQSRELVTMSRAEFISATELRVTDPEGTLDALVRSKLATDQNGAITIHGNEPHVERIKQLRGMASLGGKARHKAAATQPTRQPLRSPHGSRAGNRAAADTHASSQRSLLPTPYSLLQKQDPDLTAVPNLPPTLHKPDLPNEIRGESPGSLSSGSKTGAIRLAYLGAYRTKFDREFVGWGRRENGQASNLLASWPIHRVLELIPPYFTWQNPFAIKAGYPFGFFVQAIHELDTDTHAPDRKRIANAVSANDRQIGNEDAEKLRYEEEMKTLRKGWDTIEAGAHTSPSLVPQKPVKQAVKQLLEASLPLGGES